MIVALKNLAPLTLYVVFIFVVLACLMGKVRLGLLFLVPLLPLQNVVEKLQYYPLGKDFNDILILSMIFGWILSKLSSHTTLIAKTVYNPIIFLYVIFTYITLWMGSQYLHEPIPINPLDPRVQNWKNYIVLPILFLITLNNIEDTKQMRQIIFVMCASIFLMNYYNVQQVRDMTSWVSRAKVHGTFVWLGANEVAAFYATYTFVLVGLFLLLKEKRVRLGLGWLIAINFFIDLFMYSRAAYLATFMGAMVIAGARLKILLVPLIALVVMWQTLLPKDVIERIEFSQQEGQLDDSAATRLILWEQSMIYFQENPVLGVGFNVFSKLGMKRDTHNVYLRTLAEQGLIGFLFLIVIMLVALARGWRLYKKADDPFLKGLGLGFAACCVAVMVGNFFGDRWTPLPLAAFYWVFLGMVERGNLMLEEEKTVQEEVVKKDKAKRYGYHGRQKA